MLKYFFNEFILFDLPDHCTIIVRSQFVVQTYSAMAQWAQDNKFVESELENWVLVDSGYNYHNFKDCLNEIAEINGNRFSIR